MSTYGDTIRDMARAERGAGAEWNAEADAAIVALAVQKRPFTSVDVWQSGLARPRVPQAIGPRLRAAERLGVIRRTGRWCEVPKSFSHQLRNRAPSRPVLVREWIGV